MLNNRKILSINNVGKKYKTGKGIADISFDISEGTMVGVVGLNGAGKTTLLNCITGKFNVDMGSISYDFGEHVSTKFHAGLLDEMGIVMRDQGFPDHFTAIIINKIMRRIYKNWNERDFFSILSNFSIDINLKIKQYSTGMKSALALSIALSHQAQILILDEIMEGLDLIARKKVREYLFDFIDSGETTVLFTTHEMGELEKIADNIVLIHYGKVFLVSSKDDLRYQYRVFKVTKKQFSEINKDDILYFKNEDCFVSVVPKDTKKFSEKYKIDSSWDSIEKIFEILLEGE